MNGREWTEKELQFLKDNNSNMQRKEMAAILGRSTPVVESKTRELGLTKYSPWTDEQKQYLKKNFRKLSNAEMADELGKNEDNLRAIAYKMGLKKKGPELIEEPEVIPEEIIKQRMKLRQQRGTSASTVNQLYGINI